MNVRAGSLKHNDDSRERNNRIGEHVENDLDRLVDCRHDDYRPRLSAVGSDSVFSSPGTRSDILNHRSMELSEENVPSQIPSGSDSVGGGSAAVTVVVAELDNNPVNKSSGSSLGSSSSSFPQKIVEKFRHVENYLYGFRGMQSTSSSPHHSHRTATSQVSSTTSFTATSSFSSSPSPSSPSTTESLTSGSSVADSSGPGSAGIISLSSREAFDNPYSRGSTSTATNDNADSDFNSDSDSNSNSNADSNADSNSGPVSDSDSVSRRLNRPPPPRLSAIDRMVDPTAASSPNRRDDGRTIAAENARLSLRNLSESSSPSTEAARRIEREARWLIHGPPVLTAPMTTTSSPVELSLSTSPSLLKRNSFSSSRLSQRSNSILSGVVASSPLSSTASRNVDSRFSQDRPVMSIRPSLSASSPMEFSPASSSPSSLSPSSSSPSLAHRSSSLSSSSSLLSPSAASLNSPIMVSQRISESSSSPVGNRMSPVLFAKVDTLNTRLDTLEEFNASLIAERRELNTSLMQSKRDVVSKDRIVQNLRDRVSELERESIHHQVQERCRSSTPPLFHPQSSGGTVGGDPDSNDRLNRLRDSGPVGVDRYQSLQRSLSASSITTAPSAGEDISMDIKEEDSYLAALSSQPLEVPRHPHSRAALDTLMTESELRTAFQKSQSLCYSLEQEVRLLRIKNENLTAMMRAEEDKTHEQDKDGRLLKLENTRLSNELLSWSIHRDKLIRRVHEEAEVVLRVRTEVDIRAAQHETEITCLRSENEASKSQIRNLQSELETIAAEAERKCVVRMGEQDEKIRALERQNERLEQELAVLRSTLSLRDESIAEQSETIAQFREAFKYRERQHLQDRDLWVDRFREVQLQKSMT